MTDDWNSDMAGRPAEQLAGPPVGRPRRLALTAVQRRQRNLLIGLSISGVLVLIAGMVAFVATRGESESDQPSVLPTSSVSATSVPESTTVPSTTVLTTVAPTTIAPTTTPIAANAAAGEDLAVDVGVEFTLLASDLSPGTPNAAVRWTQTAGPDVTAGAGSLRGAAAVATAPAEVSTLVFTLEVAGTDGVAVDDLIVRVFEDADRSVFVDGELGADNGDGSLTDPFKTVNAAAAAAAGRDLYIRSVGVYDTRSATLELGDGVSLYGGFDESWIRNTDRRVVIDGAPIALRSTGATARSISAVEVTSSDAGLGERSVGIEVSGVGTVQLTDSRVVAGDGGGGVDGPGGVSAGLLVSGADQVTILRSTVNAGRGGAGSDAVRVDAAFAAGASGRDGSGTAAGAGGGSGATAGTRGGNGGSTGAGENAPSGGGKGGRSASPNGGPGSGGSGGVGGQGGDGGDGTVTTDTGATDPRGAPGAVGDDGSAGSGATGGGGGFGPLLVDGGGGGGGGAGGLPGDGAAGGQGGGGSVGVWTVEVRRLVIIESFVAGGGGGDGGSGAPAPEGQSGGAGGRGAAGVDGVSADGGNGGGGGGGGAGGGGGGGAGGPSFGILTSRVEIAEVTASTIRGGGGGTGDDGGTGGVQGGDGAPGSGRTAGVAGAVGGGVGSGVGAAPGAGASGGSSYGWFDDDAADQVFDAAEFLEGIAGRGGDGSTPGADGAQRASNV